MFLDWSPMLNSDAIQWWLLPLSGNLEHVLSTAVAWHGRLMVFAWALLVPLGVGIARFFKVTQKQKWPEQLDNKFWWRVHLYGQSIAILITLFSLFLILSTSPASSDIAAWHRTMGWIVIVLVMTQGLSGFVRGSKGGPTDALMRGDHFDMTTRRIVFEYVHKSLGYITLLFASLAIGLGLLTTNAPRWMFASLAAWWLLLILIFSWLQIRGYCIDTYQAIWGHTSDLPGNQRMPIGWGIRRPQDTKTRRSV